MALSEPLRDPEGVRSRWAKRLDDLVEQARLTTSTTAFMRKQMADLIKIAIDEANDAARFAYLANGDVNFEAVDECVNREADAEDENDTALNRLREFVDDCVELDQEYGDEVDV